MQLGAYAAKKLLTPSAHERLLLHCSTNVDNLRAGRWDTLLTSALVVESPMELPYALLLLAVLGYAEYAYGAWWAAGAFLYGHVGASLLVYGGLRALRTNAATRSAVDVGISYGRNALAGALAATLRGARVRTSSCTVLIALSARPFLRGRTDFTDAGHLVSLGLGLSLGAWGRRRGLGYRSPQ